VYHALTIVSESEILNDLLYDPKPVQKRRVSIRSTVLIERGVGVTRKILMTRVLNAFKYKVRTLRDCDCLNRLHKFPKI
jgi:hypothetical protein